MGADAGLLEAFGALKPDGAAAKGGHQNADEKGELIAEGQRFVHLGKHFRHMGTSFAGQYLI